MTRYAIYARPGVLGERDAPAALRLCETVEAWYAREEFCDLTIDARRYGFHATLTAPFRLAEGRTEADLLDAANAFAAARAPVVIPAPEPQRLSEFRALRPSGDEEPLSALAADAVRAFDSFRAPPTELEVRRRRPERMTERERELFARWGYPYVFDQFRFHMTLTDRIPADRADEVDAALQQHFASVTGVDVPLLAIAVFIEPEPGAPFSVLSAHTFDRSSQEAHS